MDSELFFPENEISNFKISKIIKRDGRIAAFNKDKITQSIFRAVVDVGGSNKELASELSDKVIKTINSAYHIDSIPAVEEIQDIIEKVLVENGHYKTAKAYILYRAEHARIREAKNSRIIAEDNIPYKLLWRVFTWNVDHGCDTISNLNKHILKGTFNKLIAEAEKVYHNEISKTAEKILENKNPKKLVIVAGPSSSGKTTTTMKISEQLQKKGKNFVLLNLDNYFKNLEEHPKDEYGDYDYEAPEALDIEMINNHISRLIKGEKIMIPEYNFKTGKRSFNVKELKLEQDQVLLIDSLHGLYPKITVDVPQELIFKFYIEALCQIRDSKGEFVRWADLRMLRRMVRDFWHRSYNPEQTAGHWHYVRRSEKKYIVPFINNADYVFNGAMPYELPVLKSKLIKYFKNMISKFENDPGKLDAYIRCKRVNEIFVETESLDDDSCIPENSIMREFIGSSSYKY